MGVPTNNEGELFLFWMRASLCGVRHLIVFLHTSLVTSDIEVLRVPFGHLNVYFEEIPVHFLSPFLDGLGLLFVCLFL